MERYELLHKATQHCNVGMIIQQIDKLRSQAADLSVLRRTAYLNFVALDCEKANLLLRNRATDLAQHLVYFLVERNRELNKK